MFLALLYGIDLNLNELLHDDMVGIVIRDLALLFHKGLLSLISHHEITNV